MRELKSSDSALNINTIMPKTADKFRVSISKCIHGQIIITSGVDALRTDAERKSGQGYPKWRNKGSEWLLQAENRRKQMEIDLLKVGRDRKEAVLSQVRYETIYPCNTQLHETKSYPICQLYDLIGSTFHRIINGSTGKESMNEIFNKALLPMIKDAYEEKDGILGYRQMTIKLNQERPFNDKSTSEYTDLWAS
ncbi:hypothetical protein P7H16_06890 [Paenibacillus larvae]|nr:hypothetical protein [Paenibacillus larvae]MDT2246730.1 hypothetical protein [Paenibacillus larvae]